MSISFGIDRLAIGGYFFEIRFHNAKIKFLVALSMACIFHMMKLSFL